MSEGSVFRPDVNKMGRGSGERIPAYLEKYGVTDQEYGNTFRFEAATIHHHWEVDHAGESENPIDHPDGPRPYSCETCRTMANRVSCAIQLAAIKNGVPVAQLDGMSGSHLTYKSVVERVNRAVPLFIEDAARKGVANEQAKLTQGQQSEA